MEDRWIALASAIVIAATASLAHAQTTDAAPVPETSATESGVSAETAPATSEAGSAAAPQATGAVDDAETRADESAATPPPSDRHSLGEALTIAGVSVLAGTWVLTGAVSTTLVVISNNRSSTIAESWIPLVGPWIMVGDSAGFDSGQLALTIVSGVLQTLSCAALIAGIVLLNEEPSTASVSRLMVVPTAGNQSAGLSITGWW